MDILIGYTGFVGSNLTSQHSFSRVFNSKNVEDAFGSTPDMCVYAGVRAEKYLANKEPSKDLDTIKNAIKNITEICPKRLVLISTIDIYKDPVGVDENSAVDTNGLQSYGLNRYYLEQWVSKNVENHHIIRLPGLFGKNIKKNLIYDLIYFLPSMLNEDKFTELSSKSELIKKFYIKQDNGFYKCVCNDKQEIDVLKKLFTKLNFSAVNFTDSRGIFQFYNLSYLWNHIQVAINNNIRLLNLAVEPVTVSEIYTKVNGNQIINELPPVPPKYDFKSRYAELFGGRNGYVFTKEQVINDIVTFIQAHSK